MILVNNGAFCSSVETKTVFYLIWNECLIPCSIVTSMDTKGSRTCESHSLFIVYSLPNVLISFSPRSSSPSLLLHSSLSTSSVPLLCLSCLSSLRILLQFFFVLFFLCWWIKILTIPGGSCTMKQSSVFLSFCLRSRLWCPLSAS